MRKRILAVCLVLTALAPLAADMGPSIPDNFWALGPWLGYTWSDNLSGWTVGFEALKSWAVFTYAAGAKYVASDNDKSDFSGNKGLLTFYIEGTVALPFPVGIGVNWNFALGDSAGPGLQLYYGIPLPLARKFYISLFWRASWIWLDGNPETMNEVGICIKRSNLADKLDTAANRRHQWRERYQKERDEQLRRARQSTTTNREPQGAPR